MYGGFQLISSKTTETGLKPIFSAKPKHKIGGSISVSAETLKP